jgi:hypothetical protein
MNSKNRFTSLGVLSFALLLLTVVPRLVDGVQESTAESAQMPTPQSHEPLDPRWSVPGTGSITFPETGKSVNGIFLDYWKSHGGLTQQGYPISDVIGEVSDLDGRLYTVQYFERAAFEYHPENQLPYKVLLSQLGTFEYRKKYPSGAPNQHPNKEPGFLFFAPTGHYLGGAFLDYWQKNGGLMQQGYPISEEFMKVSELNGKPYMVQYFERAVFEWHPENKPPYDVLLAQLGRFRFAARYPGFQPDPQLKPQLIASTMVGKATATDRYLFWLDTRNPASRYAVYGYDLIEKREFVVSDKHPINGHLASNGNILAWVAVDDGGHTRIHTYDPATAKVSSIFESDTERYLSDLALDADTLYYQDETTGHKGLFAHDLATGAERLVSANGTGPVAADGKILWIEYEQPCSPGQSFCPWDWALHLQIEDSKIGDSLIGKSGENGFTSYSLSGDNVVWSEYFRPPTNYNLQTGMNRVLSPVEGLFPIVKGDVAVWVGGQSSSVLKVYNIATGQIAGLYPGNVWITPQAIMRGGTVIAYGAGDNSFSRDKMKSLYIISAPTP